MLERVSQFFPKKYQKGSQRRFHLKVLFKIAQNVAKYLDYFCKKICHKELSKITHSCNTA